MVRLLTASAASLVLFFGLGGEAVPASAATPLILPPLRPYPMAKTLARTWARPPVATGRADGGRTFGGDLLGPVEDFEGISKREQTSTGVQPDTEGDVGLRDYVQWVNTSFAVYSKDGRRLLGPVPGNVLWEDLDSPCATANAGDPVVVYDEAAARWIFSQFTGLSPDGEYFQCIAVSTSDDATGFYTRYVLEMPQLGSGTSLHDVFNDYSKLSVWKESYVMTDFQRDEYPQGVGVFAFDRVAMLNGLPARAVYFDLSGQAPMLPSDLDGPLVPPSDPILVQAPDASSSAGSTTSDALTLRRLHVVFGSRVSASIDPPFPSIGQEGVRFPALCPGVGDQCIPQPGTPETLDAIADRPMFRAAYRSFGSFGKLVVLRTVGVGNPPHAALRWYEIRDEAGKPSLVRAGTYGDGDSAWRWMGSAALDRQGDVGLGFSLSDPSVSSPVYPSIGYDGVPAGSTPPLAEGRLATGGASQQGRHEWGDYSSLSVDPADQCTFWYTQEYYPAGEPQPANGETPWHTRIGSLKFPGCGATPSIVPDPGLGTREGGLLTAQPGDWAGVAGAPPFSLAYEWRRCDVGGGSCTAIPGADGRTYRLTSSDVDSTIRVAVRATTGIAFASALSQATPRVTPLPAAVPLDLLVRTDPVSPTVTAGSDVVFTLRVSNQTLAGTATHVVLRDTPPAAADVVSVTPSRGSRCDVTARPIVCPLDYLPPGVTATVTVTLRPSARGRLENTATVSADQADPGPSPNTTTAATLVAGPPVLQALDAVLVARPKAGRVVVSTRLSVDEPATVTATVHAIGSQAPLPLRRGSVLGATVLGHRRSAISTRRAEGGEFHLALRLARRQLRATRYEVALSAVAADGMRASLRLPFARPAS